MPCYRGYSKDTLEVIVPIEQTPDRELGALQRKDPKLKEIVDFLEKGTRPEDEAAQTRNWGVIC